MPPKGKKNEPSKKTQEKVKAKVIEDKTFGLKNKKGAKTQKFITQVEKTVKHGGPKSARQLEKEREDKFAQKDKKKAAQDELNSLFKPVEQKVSKGVDPKSVLCAFFKAGNCGKGDKCKFSHDLNIARKSEKRSLYDAEKDEKADTMENWDEAQLEEVINKKHGEKDKAKPKTSIICKHFLQAVENNKYGWFWECPTGDKCIYKHALPPGFQLKKDKKKAEANKEEISLEELVEKERAALSSKNLTKVTLESFLIWKEKKRKEKVAALNKSKASKKKNYMQGKAFGVSGREMFEFNPELVVGEDDDEDGMDLSKFRNEDDEEGAYDGPVREINLEDLAESASTAVPPPPQPLVNGEVNGNDENSKLDMAAALPPDPEAATQQAIAAAEAAIADGGGAAGCDVDIDENLFDADDLLDIENELETLDLES